MSLYEHQVLPRLLSWGMGLRYFETHRAATLEGLSGTVLEVGFGAGHNLPHYPAAVREVLAIEPSDLARRKAAARIHAAPFPVHFAGLDGQRIELDDQSVDGIACTWTLCSIPDVHAALEEMRRVLKPGARLHFFEHGLSLDAKVAASQHRWTPVQKRLFGGCHLDRDIAGLLSAHFPHLAATPKTLRGPRILTTCLHGQAWG